MTDARREITFNVRRNDEVDISPEYINGMLCLSDGLDHGDLGTEELLGLLASVWVPDVSEMAEGVESPQPGDGGMNRVPCEIEATITVRVSEAAIEGAARARGEMRGLAEEVNVPEPPGLSEEESEAWQEERDRETDWLSRENAIFDRMWEARPR